MPWALASQSLSMLNLLLLNLHTHAYTPPNTPPPPPPLNSSLIPSCHICCCVLCWSLWISALDGSLLWSPYLKFACSNDCCGSTERENCKYGDQSSNLFKAVICKDQQSKRLQIWRLWLTHKHIARQVPAANQKIIKVTRCIDSRLTQPKWHFAALKLTYQSEVSD